MSVTVVGRWHPPAVQADQAGASARQQLMTRPGSPPARRSAQVFQAIDDTAALLYVSEWSDRAAFDAYRAEAEPGTIEASIRDDGEFLICERELFFGNYTYRASIVGCCIAEASSESDDAIRTMLVPDGRWVMHGSPGLVYYAVYREVTHSHRYVIVHGWQSTAALLAMRERREVLRQTIDGLGGRTILFSGVEGVTADLF